ncbi:hypothetical protein TSUD_417910 [Trifolium subterraneum]|uniref:Putative plant transposon protein domain-containing protein n=1 Tax=Trifolium subterraneum TaxID=3900 RepID=A0A1B5Z8P6_TRISU|nr:hypothetical protein TSUD_417910 [Trifolium subterraneum]
MNTQAGKGKKKASTNQAEKPPKKTRASPRSGPGDTSEPAQPVPLDFIDARFISETASRRYAQITAFNFVQEKGFSAELLRAVPEIYVELSRRRWERFNELLLKDSKKPGNATLAKEFFANAFAGYAEDEAHSYRTLVRGIEIDWSPRGLNAFLGTRNHRSCPLVIARAELAAIIHAGRRIEAKSAIKDAVCFPATDWLKCKTPTNPTKVHLQRFLPIARAWAEFFVKSVYCCSNSSEIQIDNALAVRMIVERTDFDLGNTLWSSLERIATNQEETFTLGHCNLITALCKAKEVPEYQSDIRLYSVKALTVGQFRGYARAGGPAPANDREEDAEMAEIDRYEQGVHPDQQQPQERHSHPHSEDEVAALMTQLAIADSCNVPHVFYNEDSTLYQAARARQAAFQPPPVFPRYQTRARLVAYQGVEAAQLNARHMGELEEWDHLYSQHQQQQFFTEEDLHFRDRDEGRSSQRDTGGSSHY